MFKELEGRLGPVTQSFMSFVYRSMTAANYHDKINPDLLDRLTRDALRVHDAKREFWDKALNHQRSRFKIVEGKWRHQTFNCPPLVFLNDAATFLEVVNAVVEGNEWDIQAKELHEAIPIEYQSPETYQLIRDAIARGVDFVATNVQYAIDAKPKSFHAFLRYSVQKDAGRVRRDRELKLETERQRYEHEKGLAVEQLKTNNAALRAVIELPEWPEMSKEVIEWYRAAYPKSQWAIDDDNNEGGLMARAHFAMNKKRYGVFERYDEEGKAL